MQTKKHRRAAQLTAAQGWTVWGHEKNPRPFRAGGLAHRWLGISQTPNTMAVAIRMKIDIVVVLSGLGIRNPRERHR